MTNEELIQKAQALLMNYKKQPNGSEFAYCGTALLTDKDNVYCGAKHNNDMCKAH